VATSSGFAVPLVRCPQHSFERTRENGSWLTTFGIRTSGIAARSRAARHWVRRCSGAARRHDAVAGHGRPPSVRPRLTRSARFSRCPEPGRRRQNRASRLADAVDRNQTRTRASMAGRLRSWLPMTNPSPTSAPQEPKRCSEDKIDAPSAASCPTSVSPVCRCRRAEGRQQ